MTPCYQISCYTFDHTSLWRLGAVCPSSTLSTEYCRLFAIKHVLGHTTEGFLVFDFTGDPFHTMVNSFIGRISNSTMAFQPSFPFSLAKVVYYNLSHRVAGLGEILSKAERVAVFSLPATHSSNIQCLLLLQFCPWV